MHFSHGLFLIRISGNVHLKEQKMCMCVSVAVLLPLGPSLLDGLPLLRPYSYQLHISLEDLLLCLAPTHPRLTHFPYDIIFKDARSSRLAWAHATLDLYKRHRRVSSNWYVNPLPFSDFFSCLKRRKRRKKGENTRSGIIVSLSLGSREMIHHHMYTSPGSGSKRDFFSFFLFGFSKNFRNCAVWVFVPWEGCGAGVGVGWMLGRLLW